MNKRKTIAAVKITVALLCLTLLVGTALFYTGKTVLKAVYPMAYTDEIEKYAEEYELPRALLYAVIHTESGFDPDAVSAAGAMGLTQITPETFRWLQSKTGETLEDAQLYDPETSIRYCALFYHMLLTEFDGDIKTAAAAYHAGRGQVNTWLSDERYSENGKTLDSIPTRDTAHYARKVLRAINVYTNLYEKEFLEDA